MLWKIQQGRACFAVLFFLIADTVPQLNAHNVRHISHLIVVVIAKNAVK